MRRIRKRRRKRINKTAAINAEYYDLPILTHFLELLDFLLFL